MRFGKAFSDNLTYGKLTRRRIHAQRGAHPRQTSSWGVTFLTLAVFSLAGIFVTKLCLLQLVHGSLNLEKSEENRVRLELIRAERGVIYDSWGNILVRNQPGFRIVLDVPQLLGSGQVDATLAFLESKLEISAQEVKLQLTSPGEFYRELSILGGLGRDEVLEVKANLDNLSGVKVVADPVRDYLYPEAMAHVLGYVGEVTRRDLILDESLVSGDSVGQVGIESFYDKVLRGINGKRLFETSASGTDVKKIAQKPSVAGSSLTLTLNAPLQEASYQALKSGIARSGATGGAVVVSDPWTGGILALVSFPSFNPNLFARGITEEQYQEISRDPKNPLFNRAVSAVYPPGSVFKLITATAALEEGVVTPETTINDQGSISIGEFVYRDWKLDGHGLVNMTKALGVSCDTYFYTVGGGFGSQPGIGVDKLAAWARLFGLDGVTGIDIPAEVSGLVPDKQWKRRERGGEWFLGNTYHMSIGQGDLLATPLQMNVMTAIVANGGTFYKPYLVAGAGFPLIIRESIASPQTLSVVREGMLAAASVGGTAYPLQGFSLAVGGKTGTSEFGEAGSSKTHAWLTAFAPFDDPEIVVTVLLEGGGEGSHDAGPVVREILDSWLELKE